MSDYDDPVDPGDYIDPEAMREMQVDAVNKLLDGLAQYSEIGNDFSVWAEKHGGLHPLGALVVFQTIYVFLRSYLPADITQLMLATISSFVEHLAEEHPGTFYHQLDDGEEIPAPFVKPDDDFGAGQAMLRQLIEMTEENTDGAS